METGYQIEAELLGPIPRRIVSTHRQAALIPAWVRFMVFLFIGFSLFMLYNGLTDPKLPGVLQDIHRIITSYTSGPDSGLLSGIERTGSQLLDCLIDDMHRRNAQSIAAVFFANFIVWIFFWTIYLYPLKQKSLVSRGQAVVGAITGKSTFSGDSNTNYYIHYEFQPEGRPTARHVKGKVWVTDDEYSDAEVGQPLTILYDRRRPRHNVPYRYGYYRVAGAQPDLRPIGDERTEFTPEMQAAHRFEQELLRPTPRRFRANYRSSLVWLVGLRIFLLPFVAVGMLMLLNCIDRTYMLVCGHTTTGRIINLKIESSTGSEGASSTSNSVWYAYQVRNREYHAMQSVDPDVYAGTRVGSELSVKFLPFRPGVSFPQLPGVSEAKDLALIWLVAAFWNGFTWIFGWIIYLAPVYERNLYRYGQLAVGRITAKKEFTGDDSTTYRLKYEFLPPGQPSAATINGAVTVTEGEYRAVDVGSTLSILYDGRQPQRHAPYRYGNHIIL